MLTHVAAKRSRNHLPHMSHMNVVGAIGYASTTGLDKTHLELYSTNETTRTAGPHSWGNTVLAVAYA
jgi:hypothetical protein